MSLNEIRASYDADQERRLVERQASADAAVDWSRAPEADRPPHGALRAIDQRVGRLIAETDQAYENEIQHLTQRIADGRAHSDHAEQVATTARAREVEITDRRDHLADVLTGRRRGDDEGDWSDRGRMSERVRLVTLVSVLIYLAASVVDAGLNYLAFRIMGVSPLETVVLAAGVVLVTVLLPKQIGEMFAVHRRRGRRTPRQQALMTGGAALWLLVSVFVAIIRTRYLLLPNGVGTGTPRPSLPALAGVDPIVLTAGWLAVALAVGTVVGVHAMHRYNPYLRPWRVADRGVRRARAEHAARRRDADQAHRDLDTAVAGTETLRRNHDSSIVACRAFGNELQELYRTAFNRYRGAPERRSTPPALPSTVEEPS